MKKKDAVSFAPRKDATSEARLIAHAMCSARATSHVLPSNPHSRYDRVSATRPSKICVGDDDVNKERMVCDETMQDTFWSCALSLQYHRPSPD